MNSSVLDQLDTFGPERCPQLTYEEAAAYTRRLARTHYENFTVVSWLLPRRLRDDFRHVYAFCRWADDLGDEAGDRERALRLLEWWRGELDLCYADRPRHPVFVALRRTVTTHQIPRKPFDDLIDAFIQDQRVTRYSNYAQVLDYCTRSANPVGRLVLYLCGYRDERRQELSDATCTALQLTNFWQDVRRDILERDRVYIPEEVALLHGLDIEQMVSVVRASVSASSPSAELAALRPVYRAVVRDLVKQTWELFRTGRELWPLVDSSVRADIRLFTEGGEAVLRLIEGQDYDTLIARPALSKAHKMRLLLSAMFDRFFGVGSSGRRGGAGHV